MDPRDFVKKLEEAKKLPAETKVWKWSIKAQKGGSNPSKLLISNLDADITKGALINLFGQEGQLQSASLQRRMIMVGDGMVAPLRLVEDPDQTIDLDLDQE